MAVYSGLFNSINGDRRYEAWWFALYFSTFIGNGVFPNPSNNLQIIENQNMTVTVKPGKGWINGYFIYNDSDFVLQHDRADGVLKRIDRIVMRLDYNAREIALVIKKGNLASNPVAPALQRDADAHELALADVYIGSGVTSITQANITDLRMNSNYCGIVAGVVQQIDVSSVFNQYQAWFDNYSVTKAQEFHDWQTMIMDSVEAWIDAQEQDFLAWRQAEEQLFQTWFATIVDILDSNAAGNLLLLIDQHKDEAMPHKFTSNGVEYKYGWRVDNGELKFVYEEV